MGQTRKSQGLLFHPAVTGVAQREATSRGSAEEAKGNSGCVEWSPPAQGTAERSRTGSWLFMNGGMRRRNTKQRGGWKERRQEGGNGRERGRMKGWEEKRMEEKGEGIEGRKEGKK